MLLHTIRRISDGLYAVKERNCFYTFKPNIEDCVVYNSKIDAVRDLRYGFLLAYSNLDTNINDYEIVTFKVSKLNFVETTCLSPDYMVELK